MTVLVWYLGYNGPRKCLTQPSNLLSSWFSVLVLKLSRLCLQMCFGWSLPHFYSGWLWSVCDGADVYTALDSWEKCITLSSNVISDHLCFSVLFPPMETAVWEKLHKSHQMNCVVCQRQNGIFIPAHLIFTWLKMYSLWDCCYHVGCSMARKANLVEKLAGVSHLIEINTKPL